MLWWIWVVAGLVFAGLELLTLGSFFWIFFAVGAVAAGAAAALVPWFGLMEQGVIFLAISLGSLLFFLGSKTRKRLTNGPPEVDRIVGETAVALDPIAPGALGKVELRGTPWQARNDSAEPILPHDRRRVERVEGLTLHLGGQA